MMATGRGHSTVGHELLRKLPMKCDYIIIQPRKTEYRSQETPKLTASYVYRRQLLKNNIERV